MGRRKTAKNVTISPWLSAKLDCREGRFIQVGNSLLLSDVYKSLNATARQLYLCMTMEAAGKPTVKFSHGAAKKYGIAATSFDRATKQLHDAGFIDLIEDDERYQYKANEYRFSSRWKSKPAPHFGEGQK